MINNSNFLKHCNSLQSSICDFAIYSIRKVSGQCVILGTRTSYIAGVNWRKRVCGGCNYRAGQECMHVHTVCACTYFIKNQKGEISESRERDSKIQAC